MYGITGGTTRFGGAAACYGVATMSRLLQIIGLFCRMSSLLKGFLAKETYDFKEPTNRSHPIPLVVAQFGISIWGSSYEGSPSFTSQSVAQNLEAYDVVKCVAECVAVCCSVMLCMRWQ